MKSTVCTKPITLTNKKIQELYNWLVNTTQYGRQLYAINMNLGSYNEAHDYAQETLITLVEKMRANKAVFYTEAQLKAYCSKILGMRLLRQHRDYTIVASRKCYTVDIDGDTISGSKVEDIAGMLHADESKSCESLAYLENLKDYVVGYAYNNAEVVHYSKMYSLDKSNSIISLYKVLENIYSLGLIKGLKELGIVNNQAIAVTEAITDFLGFSEDQVLPTKSKPAKHVMGSRDRLLATQMLNKLKSRELISLNEMNSSRAGKDTESFYSVYDELKHANACYEVA